MSGHIEAYVFIRAFCWISYYLFFLAWVAQTLIKFKCQLKFNWLYTILEMNMELIYMKV
jgi:hypothetical protein